MRCLVGVVLFVVLYFGSCAMAGAIVGAQAGAASPRYARQAGAAARARFLKKYHALIAVGAGVITLAGCALPTILLRMNEKSEQRKYEEWQHG